MVPIQPQKRPRSPNQRRITSYPSRSRAGIQESFQNRGSRRAARRGRVGEKNARWQLRLAQITNQTQRRTSRTRFKSIHQNSSCLFTPQQPRSGIPNIVAPKHQPPISARRTPHLADPRSRRRKAAGGEGSGYSRAHLLMEDAMATTTPLALLLLGPHGGSGATTCDTGDDALSAMADLSLSLSAKISRRGGCRRGGRDLGRSWLLCACATSLSALALEQGVSPGRRGRLLKRGSREPPSPSVFYFFLSFCRCRF